MSSDLSGKWKHDRSENFEGFLDKIGVNALKKKMVMSFTPCLEITQDGNKFTVKASGGPKTQVTEITVGQQFESDMFDRKLKIMPSLEGNKLVLNMTPQKEGKEPMVMTREIVGEELIQTMVIGDVTCKRIFKKQ